MSTTRRATTPCSSATRTASSSSTSLHRVGRRERIQHEVTMATMAASVATELGRRLIWHGVLLFFLGLVGGMFVYSMANPRMGLTAHVGAVTNGTYLIAL